MDQADGAADLAVLQGAEPAGLGRRITLDPGADGLDHQDVGQPRHHGFAAGAHGAGLVTHEAQGALQPVGMFGACSLHMQHWRQQPNQLPRHRMLEAHRAANQAGRRATAAVADDLVALTHAFPWQVEQRHRSHAGRAEQVVAVSMGHQRQVAAAQ
ncbi:hypothetical protein D9M71_599030 [compost metagenome]